MLRRPGSKLESQQCASLHASKYVCIVDGYGKVHDGTAKTMEGLAEGTRLVSRRSNRLGLVAEHEQDLVGIRGITLVRMLEYSVPQGHSDGRQSLLFPTQRYSGTRAALARFGAQRSAARQNIGLSKKCAATTATGQTRIGIQMLRRHKFARPRKTLITSARCHFLGHVLPQYQSICSQFMCSSRHFWP